jgi:hypothetical protein
VPLTSYDRDGDDSPKIVRVEIEILALGWQESEDDGDP